MGFFHTHRWKYVYVDHYYDTSYGDKVASYKATRRCEKCGIVHTPKWGEYGGGWPSLKQLNGEA